jgi:hypothetical protein
MLASIFLTILLIGVLCTVVGFAWNKNFDFFLMLGSIIIMLSAILWFGDGVQFVDGQTINYGYTCAQTNGNLSISTTNCTNATIVLASEAVDDTYYDLKDVEVASQNVGWMLSFALFFVGVWVFFMYFLLRTHRRRRLVQDGVQGEDYHADDD